MVTKDLTVEDALAELAAFLADPPVPAGFFSRQQILEQAKTANYPLTPNMLDNRLRKGIEDKTLERQKFGRMFYYRKVKE